VGDLIVIPENLHELPAIAKRKWLEAQLQEKKSSAFALKQQLDMCEQEIEDIREGKMKKIQFSMLAIDAEIKKFKDELNVVDLT
jgi:hypothetical protein